MPLRIWMLLFDPIQVDAADSTKRASPATLESKAVDASTPGTQQRLHKQISQLFSHAESTDKKSTTAGSEAEAAAAAAGYPPEYMQYYQQMAAYYQAYGYQYPTA